MSICALNVIPYFIKDYDRKTSVLWRKLRYFLTHPCSSIAWYGSRCFSYFCERKKSVLRQRLLHCSATMLIAQSRLPASDRDPTKLLMCFVTSSRVQSAQHRVRKERNEKRVYSVLSHPEQGAFG